jgi:hypothetical protein
MSLLPSSRWDPQFIHVTSYSRGINGVMIDLANLPRDTEPTIEDFVFRKAGGPFGSAWEPGPAAETVTLRRGAGQGGSDRVTLTWPDADDPRRPANRAVTNGWLDVTVRATAATGLATSYTFRFGNLVGETGDYQPVDSWFWQRKHRVDVRDLAATRAAAGSVAPRSRRFDFNRDGRVDMLDVTIARANIGRELDLRPRPFPEPAPISASPPPVPKRRADYVFILGTEKVVN